MPLPTIDEIQRTYAAKSDDELRALDLTRSELSESAQRALVNELSKRGLPLKFHQPPVQARVPDSRVKEFLSGLRLTLLGAAVAIAILFVVDPAARHDWPVFVLVIVALFVFRYAVSQLGLIRRQ